MADLETLARARWVQNAPRSWLLKARAKDGGAVLARIESVDGSYTWKTTEQRGMHGKWYGAIFAARRALREEAGDA